LLALARHSPTHAVVSKARYVHHPILPCSSLADIIN
jgi:hypothetical protein